MDPERWEFAHEEFVRGGKHRLKNIHRRKSSLTGSVGGQIQSYNGMGSDPGYMKQHRREKQVMMLELGRLCSEHRLLQQEVRLMSNRLKAIESRQEQMLGFLATTMCSPIPISNFGSTECKNFVVTNGTKNKFLRDDEDHNSERSNDSGKRPRLNNMECWGDSGLLTSTNGNTWINHQQVGDDHKNSSSRIDSHNVGPQFTTTDANMTKMYNKKLLLLPTNDSESIFNSSSLGGSSMAFDGPCGEKTKGKDDSSLECEEHVRILDDFSFLSATGSNVCIAHGGKYGVQIQVPNLDQDFDASDMFWEHLLEHPRTSK